MLAIAGRKVSSSARTADLSQRAYFKGAESISLPWYEVKAVKNEIEEDVFKMVLHRSFEEKGEERHSNACLMFCDYLKTKPQTNKHPMSETTPSCKTELSLYCGCPAVKSSAFVNMKTRVERPSWESGFCWTVCSQPAYVVEPRIQQACVLTITLVWPGHFFFVTFGSKCPEISALP